MPILSSALDSLGNRKGRPKDRIKVVLEGAFCEQPPPELIEAMEDAGCYILSDDLYLGWRWFKEDIPSHGDPLTSLALSYIERSVHSSVKHDTRTTKATHLIEKVRKTRADAVILLSAKFCEPALFDYPLLRMALEKGGIPHLFLEFEEKMWLFDKVRTDIETFVESILLD